MKAISIGLLSAAAILASAPVATAAEFFIPPSNSAANQYTESLPTSRGGADTEGERKPRKPDRVLGDSNAEALDEHGAEGRAAAELAAATAPTSIVDGSVEPAPEKKRPEDSGDPEPSPDSGSDSSAPPGANGANPAGPSGVGEVAGKATGLATAGSSLLLPLLILAALCWSVLYAVRKRAGGTA